MDPEKKLIVPGTVLHLGIAHTESGNNNLIFVGIEAGPFTVVANQTTEDMEHFVTKMTEIIAEVNRLNGAEDNG